MRPLATLLVERGFFESEDIAARWVMAGQVLINEQRLDKARIQVSSDAEIRIVGQHRYVSRGGHKLQAALDHFCIDVTGKVALDCGASTGGFTDCLLQRGASLVYAVDAGVGQLTGRLRLHSAVRNLERTNLSDLADAKLDPPPELISLDLSYLSLTKALPIAAPLLTTQGEIIALLKPLFEVESPLARRTGQIDDPGLVVEGIQRVLNASRQAGVIPLGVVKLALQPRHGVHEFFLHLTKDEKSIPWECTTARLEEIVQSSGVGSPIP
jgi:23S rRNA (cytidine1920-2'-O)/16S rRNA (cytidine1409-2'-O)-methyltransferase